MVLLRLFALVGGVAAQQCSCFRDPQRGYWSQPDCSSCDTTYLDGGANQTGVCNILDSCKDRSRPLAQRACYGAGVCQNNQTAPCACTFPNADGLFCERCKPGWVDWPACNTPACVEANCSGHGNCAIGMNLVACGVTGCTANDAAPWFGCTRISYRPAQRSCVGNADGTASAPLLATAGATACGTTTCPFGTKCGSAEYNACCPKDAEFCQPRRADIAPQCCLPGETCCDGACCPSATSCKDIVRRNFTVQQIMLRDSTSSAYGGGPVTDWLMMDGSRIEPYKECSNDYLGAVSTTRVIILPICLIIGALMALVLVWKEVGLNPAMVAIPAVLLVFLCIFLFFSRFWPTAIVITCGALFGMGAAHKGGSACLVGVAVEFFALAVVTGGLGLGQFFFSANPFAPTLFFDLQNSRDPNWSALRDCSRYYDYFSYDGNTRPYDADPLLNYRHYCSEGWYTYLGLVADLVVMLQIIMVSATVVAYVGGGAKST